MYDNKFKKAMYDYALKNNVNVKDLSEDDYKNILSEIGDDNFAEECLWRERKVLLNPMFKKAEEIMYEAYLTDNLEKTLELSKKAYETSPECYDALIMMHNIEDDHNKKLEILDKGINYEEERLKRLGYFNEEYAGKFYDIIETRNYIRLLRSKLDILIFIGRSNIAKELCLDILKLNKKDDLRVRYILLAIYAYQEDEHNFMKFYEELNEESLETILPALILYYKLNEMDKVDSYLQKAKMLSSEIIVFFKKYLADCRNEKFDVDLSDSILSVIGSINFLLNVTPGLVFYIGTLE